MSEVCFRSKYVSAVALVVLALGRANVESAGLVALAASAWYPRARPAAMGALAVEAAVKQRWIGVAGFAAAAAAHGYPALEPVANSLLALHFGLSAIDADSTGVRQAAVFTGAGALAVLLSTGAE